MSAECEAFVENHSPYRGGTFSIHLRLAMIANEAYGYRIFMSEEKMLKLCRCSAKTLQRAKRQMIEDGYLRVVFPAHGRKIAEYQFLMPGVEPEGENDRIAGHFVQNSRSFWETSPIYRNKYKESANAVSQPPVLDETIYEKMKSEASTDGVERARRLKEIALGNLRVSSEEILDTGLTT